MSSAERIFVEKYTTKRGQEKNRYRTNSNARPVKMIVHYPDNVFGK